MGVSNIYIYVHACIYQIFFLFSLFFQFSPPPNFFLHFIFREYFFKETFSFDLTSYQRGSALKIQSFFSFIKGQLIHVGLKILGSFLTLKTAAGKTSIFVIKCLYLKKKM